MSLLKSIIIEDKINASDHLQNAKIFYKNLKDIKIQYYLLFIQSTILFLFSSCSHVHSTEIDHSFSVAINAKESLHDIDKVHFEPFDDLNLGFFKGEIWIKVEVKNENSPQSFMFVNDDLINRNYVCYKLDSLKTLRLLAQDQDESKEDQRTFNSPNPNFKLDLAPNEHATFIIVSKSDGRTVNATPQLITMDSYYRLNSENNIWSVVFFGILGCLLIINIYQWSIFKQRIYLFYMLYMLSTIFMYMGLEGQLHNFGLKTLTIDHIVFITIRFWVLTLIMYTSKFLEIQTVYPKYYQFIKWLLLVVLGGTTLYQFIFYNSSIAHLHYFENTLSFLWLLVILSVILLSAKTRKLELKYYIIPLLCFLVFITFGLIDGQFQVLPGTPFIYIKLGTIVEFIGFTYFMGILIREKLKRTEKLELELLEKQKELSLSTERLKQKKKLLANKKGIEKTDIISIFKLLENSLSSEMEWAEFKLKFKELNPNFLNQLLAKHPNLTKSEIRLLTLIKIGYSQKEIASILNIAPDSVKKAKNRVRKKMNLSETIINDYLETL